MFARISRRYDLLNTVMTGGRHYAWRRTATDMAVGGLTGVALDVATGTGDFALALARHPSVSKVIGLDFTREMLSLAERKAQQKGLAQRLDLVVSDAHALPFPDDQFICATVGFGVRNFIDVPRALQEMARVVRPGGRVVVLEIVRVEGRGPLSWLFPLYFRYVTPWLGALLAGRAGGVRLLARVGRRVPECTRAGVYDAAGRSQQCDLPQNGPGHGGHPCRREGIAPAGLSTTRRAFRPAQSK